MKTTKKMTTMIAAYAFSTESRRLSSQEIPSRFAVKVYTDLFSEFIDRAKDEGRPLHRFAALCTTLLFILTLGACAGAPRDVTPVTGFEVDRYLGKWYEIARLDHPFERGLSNVTAEYSLRDEGGIRVVNSGYNAEDDEWSQAEGKAFFVGAEDTGMLKVSFFGPFYGGYNVIGLDKENYEWSLVAGPNRAYLWILARSPELPPTVRQRLIEKAGALDFPVDELIWVEHDGSSQGYGAPRAD